MSVVLCSWGDFIEGGTEETLSLAGKLSRARGLELDWLVIGGLAEAATAMAGTYGVAHIDRIAQDQHSRRPLAQWRTARQLSSSA